MVEEGAKGPQGSPPPPPPPTFWTIFYLKVSSYNSMHMIFGCPMIIAPPPTLNNGEPLKILPMI